jgi:hypothetical protein
MLTVAEQGAAEESDCASNDVARNRKIVARLEKALSVHDDVTIADGRWCLPAERHFMPRQERWNHRHYNWLRYYDDQ